jgi:hypothetical protein
VQLLCDRRRTEDHGVHPRVLLQRGAQHGNDGIRIAGIEHINARDAAQRAHITRHIGGGFGPSAVSECDIGAPARELAADGAADAAAAADDKRRAWGKSGCWHKSS